MRPKRERNLGKQEAAKLDWHLHSFVIWRHFTSRRVTFTHRRTYYPDISSPSLLKNASEPSAHVVLDGQWSGACLHLDTTKNMTMHHNSFSSIIDKRRYIYWRRCRRHKALWRSLSRVRATSGQGWIRAQTSDVKLMNGVELPEICKQ